MRVAAVILAAGASRRYGEDKLLVELEGKPLLQHAVDAANASRADEIIVVVGHDADAVLASIRLGRARAVRNPDHSAGQSTSLRLGIRAAPSRAWRALPRFACRPSRARPPRRERC